MKITNDKFSMTPGNRAAARQSLTLPIFLFAPLLLCAFALSSFAQSRSALMVSNATGVLAAPLNFFTANSNAMNAALSNGLLNGSGGVGSTNWPNVIWVSTLGNDTYPGTNFLAPSLTFTNALATRSNLFSFQTPVTIELGPGVFPMPSNTVIGANTTVLGAGMGETVLSTVTNWACRGLTTQGDNITLMNLTIGTNNQSGTYYFPLYGQCGTNFRAYFCDIEGDSDAIYDKQGGTITNLFSGLFFGCKFASGWDITGFGTTNNSVPAPSVDFEECQFFCYADPIFGGPTTRGIQWYGPGTLTVKNCTFSFLDPTGAGNIFIGIQEGVTNGVCIINEFGNSMTFSNAQVAANCYQIGSLSPATAVFNILDNLNPTNISSASGGGGIIITNWPSAQFQNLTLATLNGATPPALGASNQTWAGTNTFNTNAYFMGNVSIGMTTPNNLLQVAGLINFDNTLQNTWLGYQAGSANTTGSGNVADGGGALQLNTTGSGNVANGFKALLNNTTGSGNVANGFEALLNNTTGSGNVANGFEALLNNTTGNYNVANGFEALIANTVGGQNTADGYRALSNNTTGSYDTANGMYALKANTTGSYNVAIGENAGYNGSVPLQTMSYSTFLGYGANSSVDGVVNSTAIGNGAQVTANNQVVIGNSSVTQTLLNGNVGIGTTPLFSTLNVEGAQINSANKFNIASIDSAAVAIDTGGGVGFGGNYTGTTPTIWAGISGLKEDATDGNYGGYLSFATRPNGGAMSEKVLRGS